MRNESLRSALLKKFPYQYHAAEALKIDYSAASSAATAGQRNVSGKNCDGSWAKKSSRRCSDHKNY
jgi:hypothetical protein